MDAKQHAYRLLVVLDDANQDLRPELVDDAVDHARMAMLGLLISHCFDQTDGEGVGWGLLTALAAGLQDSNWHAEAEVVFGWLDRLDMGDTLAEVWLDDAYPDDLPF